MFFVIIQLNRTFNHRRFRFKLNNEYFDKVVDYLKINKNMIEIKNVISNFFANSMILNFYIFGFNMKMKIFNQNNDVLIIALNDYRLKIVFNEK